jgi:hypothetical protein
MRSMAAADSGSPAEISTGKTWIPCRQILLMEPAARRAQFAADSHAVAIAADDVGGFLVDVVFECSGSAAAIVSALKLLAPAGSWWWWWWGQGPSPP